jgi:hypothetical protein
MIFSPALSPQKDSKLNTSNMLNAGEKTNLTEQVDKLTAWGFKCIEFQSVLVLAE